MMTRRGYGVIFIVAVALLAAALPLVASAANLLAPVLEPPAGQTHLKGGDVVSLEGEVTPGATIQLAYLSMTDADGTEIRQENVRSATSISGGTITGSWQTVHIPDATANVEFLVSVVHADGSEQTALSPAVPVDQVSPRIEFVEFVDTDEIRITFSEPVLSPTGNQALDWRVGDLIPQNVASNPAGDVRHLQLLMPSDEDDTPYVQYIPRAPLGQPYRDGAGNTLTAKNTFSYAVDLVRPRLPEIATIDGKAPKAPATEEGIKRVISTSSGPELFIEEVTEGHTVSLFMESNGTAGLQDSDQDSLAADTTLGSQQATAEGATFSMPEGTFVEGSPATLYTRAADVAEQPNLSDVDAASYELDVTAPTLEGAKAIGKNIVITFSEPLASGRNLPLDWIVEANGTPVPVLAVNGTGDTRILETADTVPPATTVTYTPPSEDAYSDEAGNALETFITVVTDGLIASVLDAAPETAQRGVAKVHTITVDVTDQAGIEVPGTLIGFKAVGGPTASTNADGNETTPLGVIGSCFTQSDGSCSVGYTSTALGRDEIQAWIDEDHDLATTEYAAEDKDAVVPDQQDVVEVEWTAKGADLVLDARPETASQRLVFGRTIDVSVVTPTPPVDFPPVTGDSSKIKGVNVDVRVVGSNARHLGECFTAADGTCSVNFGGTEVGTDSIQVWIDRDFDDVANGGADADEFLTEDYLEDKNADGFVILDDPAQDSVDVAWALGLRNAGLSAPWRVGFTRKTRLSGTIGGDVACRATTVAIVRRVINKSAKTIKTLHTSSTGRWSFTLRPRHNATYVARSAGSSKCMAAESATKTVRVRAHVGGQLRDKTLRRGQKAVISGAVRPWKKGRSVELLMKRGRKWRVIARDRLNKRSRYHFARYTGGAGTHYFKVRYVGDRLNSSDTSRWFRVKVARQRF